MSNDLKLFARIQTFAVRVELGTPKPTCVTLCILVSSCAIRNPSSCHR